MKKVNSLKASHALKKLRVLDNVYNNRILILLLQRGPLSVLEIAIRLHLKSNHCSQQLLTLKRLKWVVSEKKGKFVFYKVAEDELEKVVKIVKQLA